MLALLSVLKFLIIAWVKWEGPSAHGLRMFVSMSTEIVALVAVLSEWMHWSSKSVVNTDVSEVSSGPTETQAQC